MSRARRFTRTPQPDELWCERAPRRQGRSARCVIITALTETHAIVRNVRTGRKSRIMLDEFTRGVLTGWYRRYAPRSPLFPREDITEKT